MDASLVLTVGRRPDGFAFLTPAPDWIELRADAAGDVAALHLRSLTPAPLLYTLRAVTHRDVSAAACERAADRLAAVIERQ